MQILQSENHTSEDESDVLLVWFGELVRFSWTLFGKGNEVSSMGDWTEVINAILVLSAHVALQKERAIVVSQQKAFHCDALSQRVRFYFLFWNYLQSHLNKVCLIICLNQIHIRVSPSSYFVLKGDIKAWRSELN